uniref:Sushi domain-containing protein n=1 Tax=Calidris pygmaea TaxID=425635 RepID=A0A8C3JEH4_9CHAR
MHVLILLLLFLAVQITVVKCIYLPSLEICNVGYLENGYFLRRQHAYIEGEKLKYRCNDDFHTEQEDGEVTCTKDGWSPTPTCVRNSECARDCGPPPEITNGIVADGSGERYRHGDRKQYECNIKFKLVGSKEIECVDGQWSSPPSCIDEDSTCPPPPQVPHAQQITAGRNYKNGSKITFSCQKNFQLIGTNEIMCIEGKWQSPPYCVGHRVDEQRNCFPCGLKLLAEN